MTYILHIPSWVPSEEALYKGNFIEKHIDAISTRNKSVTLRLASSYFKNNIEEIFNENNTIITVFYKKQNNKILALFSSFWLFARYLREAYKIKRKFGLPKLIHLHVALNMGFIASILSKLWKVPLVLTEHWTIYQPQNREKLKGKLYKKIFKIFSSVSAYTTVSHNLKDEIVALFGNSNGVVIPNVVNCNIFQQIDSPISDEKKIILHVSTLDDNAKNFSGILRAIHNLSKIRQDFILHVIHEYENIDAINFIKDNNLDSFVQFSGSKSEIEVAQMMQKCSFLLLFSNYENLPCVIEEALATGKPVLTTPVGGIPEIVNSERGLFVTPKNEVELTEKLNLMLDSFGDYDKIAIRKFAENNFSVNIIAEQYSDFYNSIIVANNKSFS